MGSDCISSWSLLIFLLLIIAGVCIAGSVSYMTVVSVLKEFFPVYSFIGVKGENAEYAELSHYSTFPHIGPYVVGIITGYFLYKRHRNIALSKIANITGWVIATGGCLALTYLLFRGFEKEDLSDPNFVAEKSSEYNAGVAIYEGLSRSLWACCISWMIMSCATGNGGFINRLLGWKPFVVLGRLTFCTYLVQGIVIHMYTLTRRTLYFYSDVQLAFDAVSVTTLSYAAGFILSVSLERPSFCLEKADI